MKKLKGLLVDVALVCGFYAAMRVPALKEPLQWLFLGAVLYFGCKWLFGGRSAGRASGTGRRARRESAPSRAGRKAGTAAYDGFMSWMTPKQPTQADLDYRRRQEAKRKYAFHGAQAEKYKGTRDGWWHEQEANRWRNGMR